MQSDPTATGRTAWATTEGDEAPEMLVPVRRALGKQASFVVEGALTPTSVGVVTRGARQYRAVVDPVFVLVARQINQALVIVHENPV